MSPAPAQAELYIRQLAVSAERAARNTPRPDDVSELERALTHAVLVAGNQRRAQSGLGALTLDDPLTEIARNYSRRMRDEHFFGHDAPDGQGLAERVPADQRWRFAKLGENLWAAEGELDWSAGPISAQAIEDWILSPSHRENLLKPDYEVAGIGAAIGAEKVIVTMLYALPLREPVLSASTRSNLLGASDRYGLSRATEIAVLEVVNEQRAARGLGNLEVDPSLSFSADEHANDAISGTVGTVEQVLNGVLNGANSRFSRAAFSLYEAEAPFDPDNRRLTGRAIENWRNNIRDTDDLFDSGYNRAGVGVATDGARITISVLLSEEPPQAPLAALVLPQPASVTQILPISETPPRSTQVAVIRGGIGPIEFAEPLFTAPANPNPVALPVTVPFPVAAVPVAALPANEISVAVPSGALDPAIGPIEVAIPPIVTADAGNDAVEFDTIYAASEPVAAQISDAEVFSAPTAAQLETSVEAGNPAIGPVEFVLGTPINPAIGPIEIASGGPIEQTEPPLNPVLETDLSSTNQILDQAAVESSFAGDGFAKPDTSPAAEPQKTRSTQKPQFNPCHTRPIHT